MAPVKVQKNVNQSCSLKFAHVNYIYPYIPCFKYKIEVIILTKTVNLYTCTCALYSHLKLETINIGIYLIKILVIEQNLLFYYNVL